MLLGSPAISRKFPGSQLYFTNRKLFSRLLKNCAGRRNTRFEPRARRELPVQCLCCTGRFQFRRFLARLPMNSRLQSPDFRCCRNGAGGATHSTGSGPRACRGACPQGAFGIALSNNRGQRAPPRLGETSRRSVEYSLAASTQAAPRLAWDSRNDKIKDVRIAKSRHKKLARRRDRASCD
jgi:hypothetical protein